ncbi:dTDP-glucose 4,6-dehydratase [Gehongia tenuis]|uniref:dTDP-glucose 4,6-dehydratase n=1 Tax=Gehongia tenuis TaxID=2763655 RepID=A0A926HLA6_9FIRM|nr:dTDP-glucose 4,6-dehydratase [Gehongia tenuis]MBC8531857.1 dTDP-glucose 4,6-dehydratase [Gehongia tenuis]
MKNYLVTGGAGFIGSNYIQYLLSTKTDVHVVNLDKLTYAGNLENLKPVEKDPRYTFIQGDIGDRALLDSILEQIDIDYVINFAAEAHVDRSILDPEIFIKTNVLGTSVLVDALRAKWTKADGTYMVGKKYVQISSDEVYGSLGPEGDFSEESRMAPRSPYSATKAAAEMLLKAFWHTYRFPMVITRSANNYGPYQFPEKLIPLIIYNARHKKPLPVYGDGQNVRDWLYVGDHCRAIERVVEEGRLGQVYNIGGDNKYTNIEVVKRIVNYLHDHVDEKIDESLITFVEDRKGHDRRYGIDATKIYNELEWKAEVPFEEGLIHTIEWYLKNWEWLEGVTSGEYQSYFKKVYGSRLK